MAVNPDGLITFRTAQRQRSMPMADLVCWGQCVEQGRGLTVVLADGSLLTAESIIADKERLTIDSKTVGTTKLPLESLSGVIFRPPSNRPDFDRLIDLAIAPLPLGNGQTKISPLPLGALENKNSLLPLGEGQGVRAADESDRLILDNADELTGQLIAITDDTAKLETDAGPIDVKTDRIVAILFNPALKRKPSPKSSQIQAWVGLSDGSRLLATQFIVQGASARLITVGQPLTVSHSSIVFLQPLGGRTVYLSDLKPTEYHQTPYLDLSWPYQPDRNATGGFLRSGGRLYLKGLGLHSAARLEYQISPLPLEEPGAKKISPLPLGEGQGVRALVSPRPLGEGQGVRAVDTPKRFQAELALDDSIGNQGSVQFRILIDGQEKYASPIIRGGNAPLPVSVDVTGVKKLELIVDYADCADVLDHANWLNARLTK